MIWCCIYSYAYGVNPDGAQWALSAQGTLSAALGTTLELPNFSTLELFDFPWETRVTDFLGRTDYESVPAYGGGTLTTSNEYDAAGRLVRTSTLCASAPLRSTIFTYDALGQPLLTCQDIDLDGQIDLNGPDRVSGQFAFYEYRSDEFLHGQPVTDGWWRVSGSFVYPEEHGSTPLTNGLSRIRLSGLGQAGAYGRLTAETVSVDPLGNATLSREYLDRDTHRTVRWTRLPDSIQPEIAFMIAGHTVSNITRSGVVTCFEYDAFGRQTAAWSESASGTRTVASYTHYNNKGQVDWTEDAAGNRTTYAYDWWGRRNSMTDPMLQKTYTDFSDDGKVLATWGATYPVAYEYDAWGRMIAMATTRNPAYASQNLWNLLDSEMLLSDTEHPDYPAALDTTLWHYDLATGLLTGKTYSDGKGPSYTYSPDGKLTTRAWARGVTTSYAYTNGSSLAAIDYSDDTPDVTFSYDRLGRQKVAQTFLSAHHYAYDPITLVLASETIIDLQTATTNVLTRATDVLGRDTGFSIGSHYSVGYSYSPHGHCAAITGVAGDYSLTNRYDYLPGSDLLVGWSNEMVTVTRGYEPNRNLLDQVLNMAGTNRVSRFDYRNDAIGRRTQRLDTLAGYALPVTNDFGYNPRSELTDAFMGTNTYGYVFDPIGNRELTRVNLTTNFYGANELNQYTNILRASAPPREDTPTYDADGNILKLRDWTLQWDAENRLVSASNDTEVIRYGHDYMGRRVWREAAGVTNRFDYDGWALIRERTYSQTHALTNSYMYGPDLSGTLQGAGTIGGLWARIGEGGVLGFSYDGNGNVTDLVDLTGAVRGHYEYAPFGGFTAMTGGLAASNPFRFSTKRQDESTGLLSYGYRDLDTVWGRWASRDPIGEKGGINLYGALLNSPVNYVDAYGNRITVTFANERDETQVVTVHATIQIIDCPTAPSEAEKDAFKRKIETVWTALAFYNETVRARVSPNVLRDESIKKKMKIRTTVDIKYITSDSKKDPDRHTFYFLEKQGTDIDRSNAEIGGNESWIYKEDHNQPRTLAHEFGHWLGLGEMYGDLIVDGRVKSVGDPDNIMSAGEDVWASQMLKIWEEYQAGNLNQGIGN